MGIGFGVFVLIGMFIMPFISDIANVEGNNLIMSIIFVSLELVAIAVLLWITGKYISPLFSNLHKNVKG